MPDRHADNCQIVAHSLLTPNTTTQDSPLGSLQPNMAGDRLRILLCIDALGVGGKERQAVELIKGFARKPDLECSVVCLEARIFYLEQLAAQGISVEFATRRVRWDVGLFYRLLRTIRQYRPHFIHTNGLISSFYALPLARLMSI